MGSGGKWTPNASDLPEVWRLPAVVRALSRVLPVEEPFLPSRELVFRALSFFSPSETRVVILGQDPYPQEGKAIGLAFGVPREYLPEGVAKARPDSLSNITREVFSSTGERVVDRSLESWARQGVLLLNTCLTVDPGAPTSHKDLGWNDFVAEVLSVVSKTTPRCVWLLWGAHARNLAPKTLPPGHLVLTAPHPSPISAHRGFLGCEHFALANEHLGEGLAVSWGERG